MSEVPAASIEWAVCDRPGCNARVPLSERLNVGYCSKPCRWLQEVATLVLHTTEVPRFRDHSHDVAWLADRLPVGNTKPVRLHRDDYNVLVALREAYDVGGRRS